MSAREYWKSRFDEYPQNDAEKLAAAMMAEYARDRTERLQVEQSARIRELEGALEQGVDAVSTWLQMDECDCPGEGHICGRPLRERQLEQMRETLNEKEQS